MSDTIGIEQLNTLRSEFKVYLREKNPHWNDSTVSSAYSHAFFALNQDVGVDFWAGLADDKSLVDLRDKIRDYVAGTGSKRPDERADIYLSALRHLKAFLEEKHPALPSEWRGKAVSGVNLKSEFQAWMKKRQKPNGERYSPNTITAYTTALRNGTAKLGLGQAVNSDLFLYASLDEFKAARQIILSAPNFKDVDEVNGNQAYSNGMKQYELFLEEMGEPSIWIFQGNPKLYDVVGAVENLDTLTWAVNQYRNRIKSGDKAYIWVSGSDGGIIASGLIACDPKMREPNGSDPYAHGDALKSSQHPYLAVDIQINHKFTNTRVPRAVLLADERSKRLEILTYPGATNFRVTKVQERVIESIIDGSYKRVPAVDDDPGELPKCRYWLYSPGSQARFWDEFQNEGIMGIGWDDFALGDLTKFESKAGIKAMMKQKSDPSKSYMNDGLTLWQFANEMAVGDVVFAKRGLNTIVGRGIVESDYIYDERRSGYKHIRKVDWVRKGEWEHPGQAAMKTLTDITRYTEYVEKLETLVGEDGGGEGAIEYPAYTEADFLNDVYISGEHYVTLKGLLLRKKNVILQGAPGVGKTFAAQRLAFSIMGEKDTSRVKMVQFHQSYGYEDFVMGYRPDGVGFNLAEGPFYKFCQSAEKDDDHRPYFFIIDEINRGNLSKIFGELLMLIEGDKRGEKNALRLLYKDEQFSVPANLHIIGLMNTADRSLAMIDYALRRRFAFFDMAPAFSSEGFKARQAEIQNPKFDALIAEVESLNKAIGDDPALGLGFRIGHSYFCTNDVVDDAWLSSVIEYELLPLLNEYWSEDAPKVESWAVRLRGAMHG